MKVRIICGAPKDGSLDSEDVIFTEDFNCPATDWIRPSHRVTVDTVQDISSPSMFPLERPLSYN